MKIEVKCTTESGDTFNTAINTDLQGAKDYYLNKVFNIGNGPEERPEKIIKVELE